MKRRGLNCLEGGLLLALILILTAISFPVFRRAEIAGSKARQRACQTNLKQMGVAMLLYAQDADGRFPLVQSGGRTYGWADALLPYSKSTALFHCPTRSYYADRIQTDPQQTRYTDY